MKITPEMLRERKQRGQKIAALTAYDFFTTQLMDEAGIEIPFPQRDIRIVERSVSA